MSTTETDAPLTPAAAELRAVLERIMDAHHAKWGDSDEWDALTDFQRAIGAAGWGAPAWPEAIGGKGLGVIDQLACDAEFARVNAPRRVAVFGVNNVGPTMHAVGTPEQQRHLAAIINGDEFWCQGFSEPDAGSDLGGLRCKADVTDDGFVVNGQKVWTSIGLNATHCMLLARTDPDAPKHKGISALLVPMDTPGLTRRAIKQINGEAEFAELFFDNAFVPRTALLGPLHDGWRVTMATLGFERAGVLSVAGTLVGQVKEMMHSQRLADAPPTLRQKALGTYSQARILEWMGQRALAETTDGPGAVSSLIKLFWSHLAAEYAEVNADVVGIDLIAGLAPDATNQLLTSRSATIAGGTTEVMKNLIGERNLGLPREPR
ncbi:MAG: acyl-CoA dehydrogenase family protein [Actinomycetota bacterium]|nr:acyl-CoA dehydrogenase family protein [Actinomycetota bacterium]